VKYWMHNNMITIDGQKMSKSLGNFITLDDIFSGHHALLEQAYSPQTVRFFMLQAQYRNPLDFSNKALQASEKAVERLMNAYHLLEQIKTDKESSFDVTELKNNCFGALNDDFNTPTLIAYLFEGVKKINSVFAGTETINPIDLKELKELYHSVLFEIMGLQEEKSEPRSDELLGKVIHVLMQLRTEAKANRDFATSDKIRNGLNEAGIEVKDTKDGFEWSVR
jgi:cysteinyl-tRNA synthetase